MTCPKCGGALVELERSGVHIDACRECRGVFLDRGELDKIVARERQHREQDDDDFVRELTGRGEHGGHGGEQKRESKYGFDAKTAEKIFNDYRGHKSKKSKKKSLLEELLG